MCWHSRSLVHRLQMRLGVDGRHSVELAEPSGSSHFSFKQLFNNLFPEVSRCRHQR